MTMNVMNVKSQTDLKFQKKEISSKDTETFSGILSKKVKEKSREEKPEASVNQKSEDDTSVENLKAKDDVADEKESVEKEKEAVNVTAVPFNLMTEKTAMQSLSVEEAEIPVDGLKILAEKSPELAGDTTGFNPAVPEAEDKISNLMNQSETAEAEVIKESKSGMDKENTETLPKDFIHELTKASNKTDTLKAADEVKPSLIDAISEESKAQVAESKGKDELSGKLLNSEAKEEATQADPKHSEKMIIPQNMDSSVSLEKKAADPETEGTLKAEENLAQMQVEKSVETVKASPVKESIPKTDFSQNLEKATDEILRSMETMRDGDKTTMKLKLHPEELGKMEITLIMEEGKLSGKILLDNHEARQLFNQKMDELSETLSRNNVQVAKFEVGIGEKQAGSQARQENGRQMQAQNPFKGYLSQRKDETVYQSTVQRTLEGIDLLA